MSFLTDQINLLLHELTTLNIQTEEGRFQVDILYNQTLQLLEDYSGKSSHFYNHAYEAFGYSQDLRISYSRQALLALRSYAEKKLLKSVSSFKQAQIDVISDILDQAQTLLNKNEVHPAAAVTLIGAALEEFLRNWCVDEGLMEDGARESIDRYATALRQSDKITKTDVKDITSWGGRRNNAAHGYWDEVSDKQAAKLMLESVNLFMRKYAPDI
jgi:hypothetical protein